MTFGPHTSVTMCVLHSVARPTPQVMHPLMNFVAMILVRLIDTHLIIQDTLLHTQTLDGEQSCG